MLRENTLEQNWKYNQQSRDTNNLGIIGQTNDNENENEYVSASI